jgi:hypothetical protein
MLLYGESKILLEHMCNILVIVEKDACQCYYIMDVYMIIILSDNCQLPIFIVAPCILKSILLTHQQMHYLLNLERFKIYTRIHTNIALTCFGLRPSSGSLYWAWLMLC